MNTTIPKATARRLLRADTLLRRSLVYVGMTAGVVAVYAGSVVLLGTVMPGDGPYATLTIVATPEGGGSPVPVAIRQLDVRRAGRVIWGFAEGWHEAELDPQTGVGWRWTSKRSVLRIKGPPQPVRLTLRGESPLRYYDEPPVVRVTAAGRVIAESKPDDDFEWGVVVPAADLIRAGGAVAIEIDRVYLPGHAEGSADRRELGLRMYETTVQPIQPAE